jgi:uncharacterized membrane protein required for colicin V production
MDGAATSASTGLMHVDLVGLVLIGVFALLGVWRGLWWQLLRLVGLGAAVLAARSLEPSVSGLLEGRLSGLDPRVLHGIVWLVLFLATGALFALLGKLGKRMLEAMQLGLVDRVGGAVAGLATGLVLHAALLAALVMIASDAFLKENLHHSFSERLVAIVGVERPFLFHSERASDVEQRLVPSATRHTPSVGSNAAPSGAVR